ncbi:hypothetical protein COO60DRAFT_1638952 [Scenedesmus sp. NREL 46B-D3]|nr:hypothetical protein COO60DRAFT_1638952 [Scenedesmus sp. NREL 46B-D3]
MQTRNRGCGKGASTKNGYRKTVITSPVSSTSQALLKPCVPVKSSDFAVSHKTHEHFLMAVCIILVWYSITEATSSIGNRNSWLEVEVLSDEEFEAAWGRATTITSALPTATALLAATTSSLPVPTSSSLADNMQQQQQKKKKKKQAKLLGNLPKAAAAAAVAVVVAVAVTGGSRQGGKLSRWMSRLAAA